MNKGTYFCGSGYGWVAQGDLAKHAAGWARDIRQLMREKKVDALAFSGSSGAAVAFAVASRIKIPLIYVRKRNEKSHGRPIECNLYHPVNNFLIVDDFIVTGDTIKHVYKSIMKHAANQKSQPTCAGIWLYDNAGRESFSVSDKVNLPVFTAGQLAK